MPLKSTADDLRRMRGAPMLAAKAMKATKKNTAAPRGPEKAASRAPELSEADIARVAYEIWEQEGRPEGRDLEHWMMARRRLLEESAPPAKEDDAPAGA